MAELIIRSGKHQGKRLILPESNIIIGRDEQCQVRIASHEVSRQHCVLRATDEGILVRDMGSRNGTFVNDVRIEGETVLHPGDTLRVGSMTLELPAGRSSPPEAGTPAEPPAAGARGAAATTEDEIARWLAVNGPADEDISTHDTTVIATTPEEMSDPDAEPKQPEPKQSEPVRKKFKTLAAEAADVIRRWQEQQSDR